VLLTILSLSLQVNAAVSGYRGVDGDTITAPLSVLPKTMPLKVRVLGIDTPEKNYLAKCELEKELGLAATELTMGLVEEAESIQLKNIKWDKYGGRIDADVYIDGVSLAETLVEAGLARPYTGQGEKPDWCDQSLLRTK